MHLFALRTTPNSSLELSDLATQTDAVYDLPTSAMRGELHWWRDAAMPGETMSPTERIKLRFQQRAGRALAARLRDEKVQHVHAHFAHAPASVAMYAADAAGISWSFTGHANDLFQRRQLLKRKLERASFVACISQWHKAWYESIHPGGRYEIVRCGVPINDYGPAPTRQAGRLRVLTVCRLVEKKGVDTLLRAAAGVPGVEVTVAGDGPMRAELEAIDPAGTRFLGAVDASAVAGLLREHDAFALPCRPAGSGDRDGIPVVLMEAMAAGLPTLGGDLPAIRELIQDGQTGRLIDVEVSLEQQIEQTAVVLRDWLADPSRAADVALEAHKLVSDEFSLGRNVERLEANFARTAAGGGS